MNVGDKYKFLGIKELDNHGSFGPWGRGGACVGLVVEVQAVQPNSGSYPIEIMLFDEEAIEWPEHWSSEARRFAVSEDELAPIEAKPIDHWR